MKPGPEIFGRYNELVVVLRELAREVFLYILIDIFA